MGQWPVVGSRQIKAGRALLDWSQEDLAHAAKLSIGTIRKLELGFISPRHATTAAVRQAIEKAGLEFIHPEGVRRRSDQVEIYEGVEALSLFRDDIDYSLRKSGGEIVIVSPGSETNSSNGVRHYDYIENLLGIHPGITIKYLFTSPPLLLPGPLPRLDVRSISPHYIDLIPFQVYGDKFAVFTQSIEQAPKIIVIESARMADASRRQFYSIWNNATSITFSSIFETTHLLVRV